MRKKRSLLCVLLLIAALSMATVCGTAFAAEGGDAEPDTPIAVDWSADETKWTEKNGFAFNDTLGMHLTASFGTYAATKAKSIGGNSTITFEIDGNLPGTDWCADWIVFKNTNDTPLTTFPYSSEISTGNWLAIYCGRGVSFTIMECKNGQITKKQVGLHCATSWESFHQKQTITITTQDTQEGVEVSMKYDSPTEHTTATYLSSNTLLWGAYSISVGRTGGNTDTVDLTSTPAATYTYKINVTDVASDKVPVDTAPELDPDNLAQNMDNWSKDGRVGTDVTADAYGLTFGGSENTYGYTLDKNVAADSTVSLTIKGKSKASGWGQTWVVFKNKSVEIDSVAPLTATKAPAAPAGTWMAFMFGASYQASILECVDGVVTRYNCTEAPVNMNGNDFNYFYAQDSELTIKTEDNADAGTVKVTLTFVGKNLALTDKTPTGKTYTIEYTTKDTSGKFLGDGALSVGAYYDNKGSIAVSSLKSDKPLVDRVVDDGLCNFVTDLKYWKNLTSEENIFSSPTAA